MAYEIPNFYVGVLPANTDLSSSQYLAVSPVVATATVGTGTGGCAVALAAANGPMLGVLQNNPGIGEAAQVMANGVSKATAGAAITIGQILMVNGSGQLIPVTTGHDGVAQALESASSGDIFSVLLKSFGLR